MVWGYLRIKGRGCRPCYPASIECREVRRSQFQALERRWKPASSVFSRLDFEEPEFHHRPQKQAHAAEGANESSQNLRARKNEFSRS